LVLIAGCFALEIAFAQPALESIAAGFIPTPEVVLDRAMLYIAIGILGATVMPHNLYLHSSIVQTRHIPPTAPAKRSAMRFATIDCVIALTFAFAVNAAILILAPDALHSAGNVEVASIEEAHRLLAPALGVPLAGAVFVVALLLSGQNATLTATLAGQIVMEGFVRLTMRPWVRRLATRLIAIIPAVCVIAFAGEGATAKLLVLSQVVLSLQLPFAVIPLVQFTSSRKTMGEFASPFWLKGTAVVIAAAVTLLNLKLVSDFLL
jgi:manganese transport protein